MAEKYFVEKLSKNDYDVFREMFSDYFIIDCDLFAQSWFVLLWKSILDFACVI